MIRTLLATVPLLAFAATAAAAAQTVTEADLRRHIAVLADDSYEGRAPGTAGGERTEAYIQDAFTQAGLAPGAAGGTWRQPIRFVERRPESGTAIWRVAGREVAVPADGLVLIGRETDLRFTNRPVFFVGYGLAQDLEGIDVRDAVLLVLAGDPPGQTGPMRSNDRFVSLAQSGAAAVLPIAPAGTPWPQVRTWIGTGKPVPLDRTAPVEGAISSLAASTLLRAAALDLERLTQEAGEPGFRARNLDAAADLNVRTHIQSFETANIVGKIQGAGASGEAVVLLAHWDHLGLCRPEGAPDRICNGAVDNASGTAILIEVARHLAAGPRPDRSIYFLATTAEESGLHGATAFAEAPPLPREKIVAALNLDTTAIGPAGLPVAIIGRGNYPGLEAVVDRTARSLGREVDSDREANVMITRQDGWAFAARDIPTIMATGSVSDMGRLNAFLGGVYHKPEDDLAHATELGGAAEDGTLHVALARALADPAVYPRP